MSLGGHKAKTSTQAQDTLSTVSRADYEDYQNRYVPVENELMGQIGNQKVHGDFIANAVGNANMSSDVMEGVQARELDRYGGVTADRQKALDRKNALQRTLNVASARKNAGDQMDKRDNFLSRAMLQIGAKKRAEYYRNYGSASQRESEWNANERQREANSNSGLSDALGIGLGLVLSTITKKHNVIEQSPGKMLDLVNNVRLVGYNYNQDVGLNGDYIGMILEESPEEFRSKNSTDHLEYTNVIGALIGSIQSLSKQVEQLKEQANGLR